MGGIVSNTALAVIALGLPALGGASSNEWVAYSAQYNETYSVHSSNGKQATSTKMGREARSNDGSQAKFELVNGQPISGELWLACGQAFSVDYTAKQARGSARNAPQHAYTPPDKPLGTAVIAGVKATGYPIHMDFGTGAVWVGTNDEIPLKIEVHTKRNGVKTDLVRELTSVDLNPNASESLMKIPDGFAVLTSFTAGSCSAK